MSTFYKINLQYLFSYLGLIPYFIILLDKYFFLKFGEEIILNFAIYYTLIILVFIGSINWDFENKIQNYLIVYGFLPSIFSVIIIIFNLYGYYAKILIVILIIFLVIQLIFDYFLIFSNFINKNAFYFLRFPLTLLISLSLIILIS
tara:strand:+ start:1832 stop:2269 length:438 start_codon:yes stop_codon:yes gene_type:complete